MRLALALLAAPAAAQTVAECEPPPVTALLEPWEETTAVIGAGAIRVAAVEDEGGVALVVLTLPPVVEDEGGEEEEAPPGRRCHLVAEGGIGFASLDVPGLETTEDAAAATLTATVPALRFVPESSELEEVTLRLTFGVADDALEAVVEAGDGAPGEAADEAVAP